MVNKQQQQQQHHNGNSRLASREQANKAAELFFGFEPGFHSISGRNYSHNPAPPILLAHPPHPH